MRRWFWRLYWPLFALLLGGYLLGPRVELALAPVRTAQSIEDVTRAQDGSSYVLGWTWVSNKERDAVSDNMDVWIDARGDSASAAVYECATGELWARSRAVGIGHHRQRYCLRLPPKIGATDPVRVRWVAYYPGWLGLWQVSIKLPDVMDAPDVTLPP